MRKAPSNEIEKFRAKGYSTKRDGNNGLFFIPSVHWIKGKRPLLKVIISTGGGWDHVSVSLEDRCPTWSEISNIKDIFFEEEETVVQFHPAHSEYINNHPFCLHLWRNQNEKYELPPSWMTGVKL